MDDKQIEFVNMNENGDFYVGYRVKVQRGIKGKTKSKVDELLIVGIPGSKFDVWCTKQGLVVKVQDKETGEITVYGKRD